MPDKRPDNTDHESSALSLAGIWPKFDALRQVRKRTADELLPDPKVEHDSQHSALVHRKMLDPIDAELVRLGELAATYKAQSRADVKHKAQILDELIRLEKTEVITVLARSLAQDIAETI